MHNNTNTDEKNKHNESAIEQEQQNN